MKTLLFVCGPNGIGKTTVCRRLVELREGTAYVDSDPCRLMNPFVLDDITIPVIARNIAGMIRNYWDCPYVDTVVFSYGFHGRRKEVFEAVLRQISDVEYTFLPVLLECSEEENIRRMQKDGRDPARIRRAVEISRTAFADADYPRMNVTHCTVDKTAEALMKLLPQ